MDAIATIEGRLSECNGLGLMFMLRYLASNYTILSF